MGGGALPKSERMRTFIPITPTPTPTKVAAKCKAQCPIKFINYASTNPKGLCNLLINYKCPTLPSRKCAPPRCRTAPPSRTRSSALNRRSRSCLPRRLICSIPLTNSNKCSNRNSRSHRSTSWARAKRSNQTKTTPLPTRKRPRRRNSLHRS